MENIFIDEIKILYNMISSQEIILKNLITKFEKNNIINETEKNNIYNEIESLDKLKHKMYTQVHDLDEYILLTNNCKIHA